MLRCSHYDAASDATKKPDAASGDPTLGALNGVNDRNCKVATGTYYGYKDNCFGVKGEEWTAGQQTCWVAQHTVGCQPKGNWEGLSNIGDNNCGKPCTEMSGGPAAGPKPRGPTS